MCASTSSYLSPSYSSTLRRLARLHTRRNAVQYSSPAQLQSVLPTVPIPIPLPQPAAVHQSQSEHSKYAPEEKELTIQVPIIVRAMSAGRKLSAPRRNRSRQTRRNNDLMDVMSPRLPPAPPSSPILRPSSSSPTSSPHLIPSPPSALFRGVNSNNSTSGPSIFSFQSPSIAHIRGHHRSQRSSSVPELFANSSIFSLDSDETKSETEMSPKGSGLKFTFERVVDGNEFDRMLQEEEMNDINLLEPQEVKNTVEVLREGKGHTHLTIRAPRVSSSYNAALSGTSPSRGLITSPPLQAVLYSHLQHLSSRFQLEEKEQQNDSKVQKAVPVVRGRRERRNAVFYSAADSQKLREELAAVIRQRNNPLFLFSSPAAFASSSSPSVHRVGRHRRQSALFTQPFHSIQTSLEECLAQVSCDVSECEEEEEIDTEEDFHEF